MQEKKNTYEHTQAAIIKLQVKLWKFKLVYTA